MDKTYLETVRLLLEIAPEVFAEPNFAIKGGTAINLFVKNMPRLSVDIDVVFTDHSKERAEALLEISDSLRRIQGTLENRGLQVELVSRQVSEEIKLLIRRDNALVKVEVNQVFRGTLLPVSLFELTSEARELFTMDMTLPSLASDELYGSKLVAAMDRQHPRDFFDVHGLLAGQGLTVDIVECFVCYLAGHNRPVHEVLFSRENDMHSTYDNEFKGMPRLSLTLKELMEVRHRLQKELPLALTSEQKEFLLGLVSGEPDWALMKIPHLCEMPAIRWKLKNLGDLKGRNPQKFKLQRDALHEKFG
jgi:predicted nucleotidyltransferase component of viral defense system